MNWNDNVLSFTIRNPVEFIQRQRQQQLSSFTVHSKRSRNTRIRLLERMVSTRASVCVGESQYITNGRGNHVLDCTWHRRSLRIIIVCCAMSHWRRCTRAILCAVWHSGTGNFISPVVRTLATATAFHSFTSLRLFWFAMRLFISNCCSVLILWMQAHSLNLCACTSKRRTR